VAEKGGITGEFGIVSDKFYAEHPEVVKAYVEILDAATKEYREGKPETIKVLASELGLSEEDTKVVIGQIIVLDKKDQTDPRYLGTTAKPGALANLLEETADFLLTDKSLKESQKAPFFQPKILTEIYD
jgi:taurine transport system substrate-binding protein